jgi:hypothetical protein
VPIGSQPQICDTSITSREEASSLTSGALGKQQRGDRDSGSRLLPIRSPVADRSPWPPRFDFNNDSDRRLRKPSPGPSRVPRSHQADQSGSIKKEDRSSEHSGHRSQHGDPGPSHHDQSTSRRRTEANAAQQLDFKFGQESTISDQASSFDHFASPSMAYLHLDNLQHDDSHQGSPLLSHTRTQLSAVLQQPQAEPPYRPQPRRTTCQPHTVLSCQQEVPSAKQTPEHNYRDFNFDYVSSLRGFPHDIGAYSPSSDETSERESRRQDRPLGLHKQVPQQVLQQKKYRGEIPNQSYPSPNREAHQSMPGDYPQSPSAQSAHRQSPRSLIQTQHGQLLPHGQVFTRPQEQRQECFDARSLPQSLLPSIATPILSASKPRRSTTSPQITCISHPSQASSPAIDDSAHQHPTIAISPSLQEHSLYHSRPNTEVDSAYTKINPGHRNVGSLATPLSQIRSPTRQPTLPDVGSPVRDPRSVGYSVPMPRMQVREQRQRSQMPLQQQNSHREEDSLQSNRPQQQALQQASEGLPGYGVAPGQKQDTPIVTALHSTSSNVQGLNFPDEGKPSRQASGKTAAKPKNGTKGLLRKKHSPLAAS